MFSSFLSKVQLSFLSKEGHLFLFKVSFWERSIRPSSLTSSQPYLILLSYSVFCKLTCMPATCKTELILHSAQSQRPLFSFLVRISFGVLDCPVPNFHIMMV